MESWEVLLAPSLGWFWSAPVTLPDGLEPGVPPPTGRVGTPLPTVHRRTSLAERRAAVSGRGLRGVGSAAAFEDGEGDPVGGCGGGDGEEEGADEEGKSDIEEGGPLEEFHEVDVVPGEDVGSPGVAEDGLADAVFENEQEGPEGRDDIVERDRDDGRDRVAPQGEGEAETQERLDAEERREPDEHADGDAARNRMRPVLDVQNLVH